MNSFHFGMKYEHFGNFKLLVANKNLTNDEC